MIRRRTTALTSAVAAALVLLGCGAADPGPDPGTDPGSGEPGRGTMDAAYQVLVFSRTAGFRHDSIPAGIAAVRDLGAAHGFAVDATEDPAAFTPANLRRYAAVVFLNTTGDVLDDAGQAAFEGYIRDGGGFVGVHAAADTEYDWPFYAELLGAYFAGHPPVQPATVEVLDRAHPATAHLPAEWARTDEWYDYRTRPSDAKVLATLDTGSYTGGGMAPPHPHAWCRGDVGGRVFYTGGGHTSEAYAEPAFRAHLLGGIRYAAGRHHADCRPETGYLTLYDGSVRGWTQAGPGGFRSEDGTLTSHGGLGLLRYADRPFTAYSLKLDWRVTGDSNSGVFVGVPASDDPSAAVRHGYEVQIDASDVPERTTGAVYGVRGADLAARDGALNPPGQWNTFELLVDPGRLRVYLNGVLVNDLTPTDPDRSLAGHIGLQNHGDGDEVAFRNVRIRPRSDGQR
ncbi:ThuA domain-containing protein [Solwaraspora sp. WMMB335]|uniref:ThuA domain-containing protein n=1 Tax=Solwaraspora sp. WMMB335 TaxID=3404118 RepID=UPI003B93CD3B